MKITATTSRDIETKHNSPQGLLTIQKLWAFTGLGARHFLIPVSFSFLATIFEGISVAFLLPFLKGIFEKNFLFLEQSSKFKWLFGLFPEDFLKGNSGIFIFLLAVIFGAAILKNLFVYFSSLSIAYLVRKFTHRLRCIIFDHYLGFGKKFFDQSHLGHLMQILTGHVMWLGNSLVSINGLLSQFLMTILYIMVMIYISPPLTALVFLIFPIFNSFLKWLIVKIRKTSEQQVLLQRKLSEKMHSVLSCIFLVKSYSFEKAEMRSFADQSAAVKNTDYSMDKKMNLISPLNEVAALFMFLILVAAMAFLMMKMKMGNLEGFLLYFYLLRRVLNATSGLNQAKALIANVRGPVRDIMDVFDPAEKYVVPEGNRKFLKLQNAIEFRDLKFEYHEQIPVLKGLNLTLRKGQMTAIVGTTGSGKTTLANLLLRFYDCPPKALFLDGVDIREFTFDSLHQHISLVSQEIQLFNQTLRENLVYGLLRSVLDQELNEVLEKAQLSDFVLSLPAGLDTLVGERGVKLSGGEKQRVSIARALLKKSEILILDEATSSLDSHTEQLIQKAIGEAVIGRTSIVIAHRLSTIRHADKIAVIEDGICAEEGTLAELLEKKGKFFQLWEEQKFY